MVPLANFGTVKFTSATATANGHTGSINDSAWSAESVDLVSYGGPRRFAAAAAAGGATTSSLSSGGTSFHVTWNAGHSERR